MLHPGVRWGGQAWNPRRQQFQGSLKHKGVPGHKAKTLDFEDYTRAILQPKVLPPIRFVGMRMIRFQVLQLVSLKKHLAAFNDKVFMMDDLVCRPHGHYFNLHGAAPREELEDAWKFVVGSRSRD